MSFSSGGLMYVEIAGGATGPPARGERRPPRAYTLRPSRPHGRGHPDADDQGRCRHSRRRRRRPLDREPAPAPGPRGCGLRPGPEGRRADAGVPGAHPRRHQVRASGTSGGNVRCAAGHARALAALPRRRRRDRPAWRARPLRYVLPVVPGCRRGAAGDVPGKPCHAGADDPRRTGGVPGRVRGPGGQPLPPRRLRHRRRGPASLPRGAAR